MFNAFLINYKLCFRVIDIELANEHDELVDAINTSTSQSSGKVSFNLMLNLVKNMDNGTMIKWASSDTR